MSDGTVPAADRAASEAPAGREGHIDWSRIEGSDDFRELTRRRHGFIAVAAVISLGAFAVYLFLAVFATGFMGTTVLGGVPIAWLAAMTQVLITWAVTWAYLRKADREFAPLEQRVIDRAGARFTRGGDAAPAAPARTAATEGSVR
jgi:uncharacterized membrane protein (DUF485 family)